MADAAVVAGQKNTHPVLLGNTFRKAERRLDLREQLVRQPHVGGGIGHLLDRNVELTRHRRHDLHEALRPAARRDVGREPRLVVGDGRQQPPVVAFRLADVADQVVVGRNHAGPLLEQGVRRREPRRGFAPQLLIRHGGAEAGVETVKCRQNSQERKC